MVDIRLAGMPLLFAVCLLGYPISALNQLSVGESVIVGLRVVVGVNVIVGDGGKYR